MKQRALVWFRRDLRLADNPALRAAVDGGYDGIVPVFIHAPDEEGDWAPGSAQNVWLHESLSALSAALEALGSRLIIRQGPTEDAIDALIEESGASALFWNRLYEPKLRERDDQLASRIATDHPDIGLESFQAHLLNEPWDVETRQGSPYKVFTPFWKAIKDRGIRQPLPRPAALPDVWSRIGSLELDALQLLPDINWDEGIRENWQPGEDGAHDRLETFLADAAEHYDNDRDHPAVAGTSYLSPYLHWGEISPFQVMHRTEEWLAEQSGGAVHEHMASFQSEVGWREFSHHVLYHFPKTPDMPLDSRFESFPWRHSEQDFKAWTAGRTGIPMVDAGMRELWSTGYMHNRLRMTVASFLTKNLRIAWQHGERWFWDTLVDADLANNTLGWQWAAGCGADAAPFFRIFNPARQGERFDAKGEYVRRWVPELSDLPNKHIHKPWDAPDDVLENAGVTLGDTYPKPIVDLKVSRRNALEAFDQVKN
ncbi:deoxyribodipyrimidine photo-lyase [Salinisphaera sp. Q1T1-3]|uniref:cryptochrome/photolyase family protein n=1 Tax=Salinisphaera sp. Q1T1-3 TaxID=2321229 RepID=UPI000E73693B|nr:deoxyribodipyrimidine photo-lyase [Salinisphaera sp. Q1T1-3]RJS92657.1 deoxyribodipyrimidine photo-lyase [Salinisphaera sp. Q1T1-3]